MIRWHRAAIDLRHALTKRTSTALYSTSSQPKNPRKPVTTTKPKSWVTFGTPSSAQMDKMIIFEEQDEKTVAEVDERRWPKPREIPWQAKVANCVNLIGHIKMPVQFRSDDDGRKSWAASMIRQGTGPYPLCMPVLFEGDLAHVVACHVKDNDYVYVAGHLSAEPSPLSPSTSTQSLQVIVESINFVDESSRIKKYVSHSKPKDDSKQKDHPFIDNGAAFDDNNTSIIQSWRDLLLKPQEWWDIRLEKENSTGPAFKRKDNGELLFMDAFTPQWLLKKLECLTFDRQITETKQQTASGKTHDASLGPWKDLLDEPELWRDCRKDKKDGKVSAKHPDFKRKDGSVSLWLNRVPKYILSELDNLDFGTTVPQSAPRQAKRNKGEESWKDLVENPHQWSDNRFKKRSEKAPDFTRKDTGEALWLNSAPKTILSALENVYFDDPTTVRAKNVKDVTETVGLDAPTSVRAKIVKGEESWKDVVENPNKWWDNRSKKLNNKSPDFKHKDTGEVLWLTSAPSWVLSKLPPSKATPRFGSRTKESMIS